MLPPLNSNQLVYGASIIDDKIYAVGQSGDSRIEVFDLNLNAWIFDRYVGIHDYTVVTFDGEIYVIHENGECAKYNPVTDTWQFADTPLRGSSRRGTALLDDKIYFVGGACCIETDIFEPMTVTCSKGPQLPKSMTDIISAQCVAWK